MENRRLMIAALLSATVLIVWNVIFPPPTPVEPAPPATPVGTVADEAAADVVSGPDAVAFESGAEVIAEAGSAGTASEMEVATEVEVEALPPIRGEREETRALISESLRMVVSNRGGEIRSIKLLDQLDAEGQPVELVRSRSADPYPLALLEETGASHPLNDVLWAIEDEGRDGVTLRHRSEKGTGEKRLRLTEEGLVELEIHVEGQHGWGLLLGPGLRQLDGSDPDDRWIQREASYSRGEEAEVFKPGKVDEAVTIPGTGLRWIGLEDNHFLSVFLPLEGVGQASIRPVLQREEVPESGPRFLAWTEDKPEGTVPALMVVVEPVDETLHLEGYFGAKRYDRLSNLGRGLEETVRWGMLGWLSRPLYFGLEWLYDRVVPNYGWAIVLLTLGIKLVFFPLTWKSQESMTKMQELNPKVQAIRGRYKSKLKDKQGRPNLEAQRQMNDEVMALYRESGASPVSGCLPMLLQIPVFFALYRLLATAAELRNAPWMGWVVDLASPDPYYVMPLLMGATSLGMQRMMPSSPDPMQKRIMQMMPIMFTVFAFAFPSGLVLYWLTNNLLTMGQQALLLKVRKKRENDGESIEAKGSKA